jgi:AcrR family transcriptional regulator
MPAERCDAAQNRQRILEVAKQLFAQERLGDTSMQEIAKAAGVGQGTLYRRFADKGELCEALFADDLEVFRERAEAYLRDHASTTAALSRLEWLLAQKIRFVDAHLPLFLASHEIAGSKRYDNYKKAHHVWNQQQITRLLNEAQRNGEADIADIAFTTEVILASFAPPLLAYQRLELGYSLERVISGVTHVFIHALKRGAPMDKSPRGAVVAWGRNGPQGRGALRHPPLPLTLSTSSTAKRCTLAAFARAISSYERSCAPVGC